jgi:regulator of nucleoside diphosphate kinase
MRVMSAQPTNKSIMKNRTIIVTELDHAKLTEMLAFGRGLSPRNRGDLRALEQELEHAKIIASHDVPPDVITMNSRAELLDLNTRERMNLTIVFPHEANIEEGRISVLAPVGVGMLGYRVSDIFEQPTPIGMRRLKVIRVHYQPEAALAAAN